MAVPLNIYRSHTETCVQVGVQMSLLCAIGLHLHLCGQIESMVVCHWSAPAWSNRVYGCVPVIIS